MTDDRGTAMHVIDGAQFGRPDMEFVQQQGWSGWREFWRKKTDGWCMHDD